MIVRKGLEENGVNHREDRGVGADAESQRGNGNQRESVILAERAKSITKILQKCIGERQALEVAVFFAELRDSTEAKLRLPTSFFGREAAVDIFDGEHFQVIAEFSCEILVKAVEGKSGTDASELHESPVEHC